MDFPINEEIWHLEFVNPYDRLLMRNDGSYTLGVTYPEWRSIFIANDLRGDLLDRVLYHELTHAEFVARGLIIPEYAEECLADITADNIVDVGLLAQQILSWLYRPGGLV